MSIRTFPNTAAGLEAAYAVGAPRDISISKELIYVYDGADYLARNPPLSQEEQDAKDARQYAKLVALRNMTPAQVQAWVAANVTNLAQVQDAIATLAVAVSVLARRL